jgi:hypothetical protein
MAIQIDLAASNVGVSFPTAYARITNIHGNKSGIQYRVAVFASADARQAGAREVSSAAFYCAAPTENLFAALYADLKTQPGFENSVDC